MIVEGVETKIYYKDHKTFTDQRLAKAPQFPYNASGAIVISHTMIEDDFMH